jgi:Fic-DOC domain mobile mystery protein B
MSGWQTLPGETPIDDVSGLKIRSITNRGELNQAEAENIRRAVVKYLLAKPNPRSARFDLAWSKRLHREMFGRVWRWAGEIRHTNLNIGIEHYQVETGLQMLFDDLSFWRQHATVGIVEQTVLLHHRAVQIHPFLNGNGRWARMLANVWCKLQDGRVINWPEDVIGSESAIRADYLTAIRAADRGDYTALTEMHKKYLR